MSVVYPMVDNYLKSREIVIGEENRFRSIPSYFKYTDDEGGDAINDAIEYALTKGTAKILMDCLAYVRDEDVAIPAGTDMLTLEGFGHPKMTDNPAANLDARANSGIIFDGQTITNALGAERSGKVVIEKMTLGFTGIDASAKALIDTDYIIYELRKNLFQEWGNTFDGSHGIIDGTTGGITPDTGKCIIEDCEFNLRSANVIAIAAHRENMNIIRPFFSFQFEDQIGISCVGVGAHSVISPLMWFGSGAHACEVFTILNLGKDWNFYDVSGSHQLGGLDETCSLFALDTGTPDGLVHVAKVHNLRGDFEWAIKSEASDLAIWKDDPTQLAVRLFGTFEGVPLPGMQTHELGFDYSPQYSTPGATYAARFQHAHRPIDLTGVQHARFWGTLKASDDIAGHGACAYDESDSDVLAEVIWDNQPGADVYLYGAWTPVRRTGIHRINYYRKGGDADDQISEDVVGVELR